MSLERIWIDVTTLLGWRRPPIGIIRTEMECARFALKDLSSRLRFCRYSNLNGFEEVEPRIIRSHIGRIRSGRIERDVCFEQQAIKKNFSPFGVGYVYVSMGFDWEDMNLVVLGHIKKETQLKVILTCYDTIPVKFPHLCVRLDREDPAGEFANYFCAVAGVADCVLCVSDRTQQDLRELLEWKGAPLPVMRRIELGSDFLAEEELGLSQSVRGLIAEPFLLFVSSIERRKNHEVLDRAYLRLLQQSDIECPRLVFAGMKGWGVSDLLNDLRLDGRVKDRLVVLDDVDDTSLHALYRRCAFTLFPSWYEGWGLAISESLSHGKFCLASPVGAIPEVGMDFIDYVDPDDAAEWVRKIRSYLVDPSAVREREEHIRLKYVAPRWEDTFERILAVAQEVSVRPT